MPGKYQKLRGKIPAFEQEPTYQAKVDEAKERILGTKSGEFANVSMLASKFADAKRIKDQLEESVSSINVEIEALSQLLVSALECEDVQKVELATGALVYLQDSVYPKVEDKEKLIKWAKKHGMENLLQLPWQTTRGIATEALTEGRKLPDGITVFLKTEARVRNQRKGDDE